MANRECTQIMKSKIVQCRFIFLSEGFPFSVMWQWVEGDDSGLVSQFLGGQIQAEAMVKCLPMVRTEA